MYPNLAPEIPEVREAAGGFSVYDDDDEHHELVAIPDLVFAKFEEATQAIMHVTMDTEPSEANCRWCRAAGCDDRWTGTEQPSPPPTPAGRGWQLRLVADEETESLAA